MERQKGFSGILLIVLVLVVALGAGAYYAYTKNYFSSFLSANVKPSPASSPSLSSPSPSSSTSATDWKTYTNKDYHFSFQYPPQYTVSEKKESIDSTDLDNNKVTVIQYQYSFTTNTKVNGSPDYSGFLVNVQPTNGKTINQAFAGKDSGFGTVGVTAIPTADNHADEAAKVSNIENGDRVFRVGQNFFEVGPFQDTNVLSDGSDDISGDLGPIYDTFVFSK